MDRDEMAEVGEAYEEGRIRARARAFNRWFLRLAVGCAVVFAILLLIFLVVISFEGRKPPLGPAP